MESIRTPMFVTLSLTSVAYLLNKTKQMYCFWMVIFFNDIYRTDLEFVTDMDLPKSSVMTSNWPTRCVRNDQLVSVFYLPVSVIFHATGRHCKKSLSSLRSGNNNIRESSSISAVPMMHPHTNLSAGVIFVISCCHWAGTHLRR